MTSTYILNDADEPILCRDIRRWGMWFERHGNRRVAEDFVAACRVSTVFLGIDHNYFGEGPPILYETMIFGGVHDQNYQTRSCTKWESLAQHREAVEFLKTEYAVDMGPLFRMMQRGWLQVREWGRRKLPRPRLPRLFPGGACFMKNRLPLMTLKLVALILLWLNAWNWHKVFLQSTESGWGVVLSLVLWAVFCGGIGWYGGKIISWEYVPEGAFRRDLDAIVTETRPRGHLYLGQRQPDWGTLFMAGWHTACERASKCRNTKDLKELADVEYGNPEFCPNKSFPIAISLIRLEMMARGHY